MQYAIPMPVLVPVAAAQKLPSYIPMTPMIFSYSSVERAAGGLPPAGDPQAARRKPLAATIMRG
jgi:hypothetical protein